MQIWRKGDVVGATVIGVVLLFLCGSSGPWVTAHAEYFGWLDIDRKAMSILSTASSPPVTLPCSCTCLPHELSPPS